jgi:hypothetical protein
MKVLGFLPLALVLMTGSPAAAGPCTTDIGNLQAAFDQRLDAAAANGPAGTETTDAKLHHQPTLKSLSQAETKLGDLPPGEGKAFGEAMRRARAADDANDETACRAALAEAAAILKP